MREALGVDRVRHDRPDRPDCARRPAALRAARRDRHDRKHSPDFGVDHEQEDRRGRWRARARREAGTRRVHEDARDGSRPGRVAGRDRQGGWRRYPSRDHEQDRPIGHAVGNANEVVECIELLKGRSRPDLLENALELSERMLTLARVAKNRTEAAAMCQRALASGAALERFRAMIERQGGNPRVIDDYALMPQAPAEYILKADARAS